MNPKQRPPNMPARVWIVRQASGEKHFVDQEPLGGIAAWAAGQPGITVAEYPFGEVTYHSPPEQLKKK